MIDYAAARTMMVDTQIRPSDVTRYGIIEAFLTVPREAFVPHDLVSVAYAGTDIPLGGGRHALDPRVLAKLIDALDIGPKDLVLHVGAGLGYGTAILARLAEMVIGLESDGSLAADAGRALAAHGIDNATLQEGPLTDGAPKAAPFDVILIEGGAGHVPAALTDQLAPGGRIGAILQQGAAGQAKIGHRTEAGVSWWRAFDATAPLLPGFEPVESFAF